MSRQYLKIKVFFLLLFLGVNSMVQSQKLGDLGKAFSKGYKNVRNTFKKAEKDTRRETGKALGNVTRELGKGAENIGKTIKTGGKNIEDEIVRVGPHTVSFGKAIGKYMERSVSGTVNVFNDAGKRIEEGKLADALFHISLDPLTNTEKNLFKATQESGWINSVGAIAASAYGGAGGAAAYASWQTYRSTNGNAELALRAGIITGLTSLGTDGISKMPTGEKFELVKKAVLSGAVGGLAIAASGGKENDILEGFILAGGLVIIQDGYRNSTGHELDARAATGEPYCAAPGTEGCKIIDKAYYIDENGKPRLDFSKLDRNASFVGQGYMPIPEQGLFMGEGRPPYTWAHDSSLFMKSVGKIPGFNAMALFHDNWVLSWAMSDNMNKATIFPALVLTYYGTGESLSSKITDITINQDKKKEENQNKLARNDLSLEPYLVLAGSLEDGIIPKEFDLNPDVINQVSDFHVARTNLVPKGKQLIVRNVMNNKIQRVLVIGGISSNEKGDNEILLSPLTTKILDIDNNTKIVQAEPEDLVLISTTNSPSIDLDEGVEIAYFKKNDLLNFSELDVDEDTKWNLSIIGGEIREIENFKNNWNIDLKKGRYMYLLTNKGDNQLPWGYYGFFRVTEDGLSNSINIWDEQGEDFPAETDSYIVVNGHNISVEGELLDNIITVTNEDASIFISMLDVPNGNATINSDRFLKDCQNCFGIMLVDNNTSRNFIATSGSFKRSGKVITFDMLVVNIASTISDKPFKLKGRIALSD